MSKPAGERASGSPDADGSDEWTDEAPRWALAGTLFALTVISTLFIGVAGYVDVPYPRRAIHVLASHGHPIRAAFEAVRWLSAGWPFALPLMSILLCHEAGHYIACRIHRVPASLPMFIPLPLPPFGTMGAVIRMRERIRSRNVLLDVGASGPLAGLAIAIPVTWLGLRLSPVRIVERHGNWSQEGTSILYEALKWLAKGSIPAGHDVFLHPVAMAGWTGLFLTMINLIPYGQLDGGHVAYSLLGRAHDRLVRVIPPALAALGVGTGIYWGRFLRSEHRDPWVIGTGYTQGLSWFVFAAFIMLMHRNSRGRHPPTDDGTLSRSRQVVAIATLLLFVVLFMPVPLRVES